MVGMPEIDISDVGMGDKILAFVCWNLICFLCFWLENNIYIFRKIAGKNTTFNFTCNSLFLKEFHHRCITGSNESTYSIKFNFGFG